MKRLHRPDLFGWSQFDTQRDLDFNSVLWVRPAGNIAIDPLPLTDHDAEHLQRLGGAQWIVVTNSDHARAAEALAQLTGARIAGPRAEAAAFPIPCSRWIGDGEEIVPALHAFELQGSKTPGELLLLLDADASHAGATIISGDLVRGHEGGRLCLLPDAKLTDKTAALQSLRGILARAVVDAVLVGDGWPVFRGGQQALQELLG